MFPRGYKVIVNATWASQAELEAVARTFTDPLIAANPTAAAQSWRSVANAWLLQGKPFPIITKWQPEGHYSGWCMNPAGDIEKWANGVCVKILHSNERFEETHAFGLDGDVLEERRF